MFAYTQGDQTGKRRQFVGNFELFFKLRQTGDQKVEEIP